MYVCMCVCVCVCVYARARTHTHTIYIYIAAHGGITTSRLRSSDDTLGRFDCCRLHYQGPRVCADRWRLLTCTERGNRAETSNGCGGPPSACANSHTNSGRMVFPQQVRV